MFDSSVPRCRPVILGTDNGKLLEITLNEKDKKDGPIKELYDFEDVPEPIQGLEQQTLPGDKTLLLVATPSRLYVFVGGPILEALFASYPDSAGGAPCWMTDACIKQCGMAGG